MRTPSWDFSPNTLAIEQEMGLLYDSSLMADEDCYELLLDGEPTGIVELPVEWIRDDAVYFKHAPLPVAAPATRRRATCSTSSGASSTRPTRKAASVQLTMHPHIIGYRSRIFIVEEIIRHAKAKGDVWFATHREVVAWAKANAA